MRYRLLLILLLSPALCMQTACASNATDGIAADSAWIALFDGESLAGWTQRGGPYDGQAQWQVEQGNIVGRPGPNGEGGLLYTEQLYGNFELELEAQVPWPADSGIFLRMQPGAKGAQITLDHREAGEIGGVYADGWWLHNPAGVERFSNAWHHFRVRCIGAPMHVTAWMDGELLTDYRFPNDAAGFAREGRIGIQVHAGEDHEKIAPVRFRKLKVRPLPASSGTYFETAPDGSDSITAAGRAAGWKPLFDGVSLEGWEASGAGAGYSVQAGNLAFLFDGDSPELRTTKDFTDFHLRLDFKITRGANSGLFLRAARDGSNPAYSGCEIQILDDFHWEEDTNSELQPWQFTGSLYGAVPPGAKALHPLNEWNTFEVLLRGARLEASLNGQVLYDVDTHALEVNPAFETRATSGFIGLQRHAPARQSSASLSDSYAWFRNIFIREL